MFLRFQWLKIRRCNVLEDQVLQGTLEISEGLTLESVIGVTQKESAARPLLKNKIKSSAMIYAVVFLFRTFRPPCIVGTVVSSPFRPRAELVQHYNSQPQRVNLLPHVRHLLMPTGGLCALERLEHLYPRGARAHFGKQEDDDRPVPRGRLLSPRRARGTSLCLNVAGGEQLGLRGNGTCCRREGKRSVCRLEGAGPENPAGLTEGTES